MTDGAPTTDVTSVERPGRRQNAIRPRPTAGRRVAEHDGDS
jgi:hypothetical protein